MKDTSSDFLKYVRKHDFGKDNISISWLAHYQSEFKKEIDERSDEAIPDVSHQRELLLAFTNHLLKSGEMGDLDISDVDDFLKTNNDTAMLSCRKSSAKLSKYKRL